MSFSKEDFVLGVILGALLGCALTVGAIALSGGRYGKSETCYKEGMDANEAGLDYQCNPYEGIAKTDWQRGYNEHRVIWKKYGPK
jgi:hypothetical protein